MLLPPCPPVLQGEVCHNLGVGPPMLSLKELTADRLCTGLQQLLHQRSYRVAAEAVSASLKLDDGLSAALLAVADTLNDLEQ